MSAARCVSDPDLEHDYPLTNVRDDEVALPIKPGRKHLFLAGLAPL
jgi:hypothetical protein